MAANDYSFTPQGSGLWGSIWQGGDATHPLRGTMLQQGMEKIKANLTPQEFQSFMGTQQGQNLLASVVWGNNLTGALGGSEGVDYFPMLKQWAKQGGYDPQKTLGSYQQFQAAHPPTGGSFFGDLVGRVGEAITSPEAKIAGLAFGVPAAANALGVEGVSAPSLLGTSGATSATTPSTASTVPATADTTVGGYLSGVPGISESVGGTTSGTGVLAGNAGADAVTAANTLGTSAGVGGGVTTGAGTDLGGATTGLGAAGTIANAAGSIGTATTAPGTLNTAGQILSTVGTGVGVLSGVNQLLSGGTTPGTTPYTPQQAQQIADPFAPNRAQYATQLNQLMANPASVQNLPGYQAQMDQGIQAVNRGMAAQGRSASGAEQTALFNLGSSQQSSFFNTYLQELMNLSGANQNPAAGFQAGQSAWAGGVNQAQIGYQNLGNTLQGIGAGIGGLINIFGTGTPSSGLNPSNPSSGDILASSWNMGV